MEVSTGRSFLFRVDEGEEIVGYLTRFLEKKGIMLGTISAIGSIRDPVVAYFDRDEGGYRNIALKGDYEVVSLTGNVSVKDGKPFAHIHVALGDQDGRLYGGHLVSGETFVMEVFIQELKGGVLERKPRENNLSLWDAEKLED
ncbi:MAG: DNA-binding protein [Thermococci archaeon]|nr:DNA-binding protein [Thermococci archaeon]